MKYFGHRFQRFFTLSILMMGLSLALPAHAGFKLITPDPKASPVYTGNPLVHSYGTLQAPAAAPPPAAINLLPDNTAAASRVGTVEGFANDVPLTVALRQILPRGVMYSVADDVDIGATVSWMGGQPWQTVLNDMLAKVSLRPVYSQNMVMIERTAAKQVNFTLREPVMIDSPVPVATYAPATDTLAPLPLTAPEPVNIDMADNNPVIISNSPIEAGMMPADAPAPQTLQPMMATPEPVVKPYEVTSLDPEFKGPGATAPVMPTAHSLVPPASDSMEMLPPVTDAETIVIPDAPVAVDTTTTVVTTETAVAPVVSSPAAAVGPWQSNAGQTLHEVLSAWAQQANIEMNWLSEYDYPIQASMTFNGTFEEAVRTLLGGFMNASPAPVGRLHENAGVGQMTLIIEARGNNYNE